MTANDAGDGDAGANNLQNFPEVTFATTGGVEGVLNSIPNTTFLLEFFANSACDPSGFGEGETFLGATAVTTDGTGNTNFTAIFPVPLGDFVTATATDPANNTSEFSKCDVEVVAFEVAVDIKPGTRAYPTPYPPSGRRGPMRPTFCRKIGQLRFGVDLRL